MLFHAISSHFPETCCDVVHQIHSLPQHFSFHTTAKLPSGIFDSTFFVVFKHTFHLSSLVLYPA